MSVLRRAAQRIRHLPGLEQADPLWRLLRGPYQRLLDARGRGVEVMIGGHAPVRMPAEFAGVNWEQYEPETVAAFARWIGEHPGALVLDVGSSIGLFSAIALYADSRCEVVAFDSDLSSLAAVRRLCQYTDGKRLRVVRGFVAETPTTTRSLAEAVTATEEALAGVSGRAGTTRYVCLTDGDIGGIPTYRLDDLLAEERSGRRATLIKCDVEGAELLVLLGAEQYLRSAAPALLLSVHPSTLPDYGHSKADAETLLESLGYDIRVLAVDHEEHWWCERG